MRSTTHCQCCGTPPVRRASRCALRRAGYHGRYWRRHSCESVMRQPPAPVDAASPPHVVHDEPPRQLDSRYDWRTPIPSPSELAAHYASARLRLAVADFLALCRAKDVPPDAIVTRFEAFLAAYSAQACSSVVRRRRDV